MKQLSGWFWIVWILWWATLPVRPLVANGHSVPPNDPGARQGMEYQIALQAPGTAAGFAEEENTTKEPAPKQPDGQTVSPEKNGPSPREPYKPSERIPADQAVDFPAGI